MNGTGDALAAAGVADGPPPTMDGTRSLIHTSAARMSGVMAMMARIRHDMDDAIKDWQNELLNADDELDYDGNHDGPAPPSGGNGG